MKLKDLLKSKHPKSLDAKNIEQSATTHDEGVHLAVEKVHHSESLLDNKNVAPLDLSQSGVRQLGVSQLGISQVSGKPIERDEKLHSVQIIFAKVLQKLKSSDLLKVVDVGDLPLVVLEMTKQVCGELLVKENKLESVDALEVHVAETSLDFDKIITK